MPTSLPSRPDLERFRRDARALQRAVRDGDAAALDRVAQHHPEGSPTDPPAFRLTAAQLVLARSYGFASWPKLVAYLAITRELGRDPVLVAENELPPAEQFCALGCLTYSEVDDPARRAEATALHEANPDLADTGIAAAAVLGDPQALRAHLRRTAVNAATGPFRWAPLLYLTYSRVPQLDAIGAARVLLDAGADPDAGYLWQGLPTPFTALTGCFGEGEQGPGRQPRHPDGERLARLLLERGAEPNDGQALYNRMFGRDDGHLRLLFEFGLGAGNGGVWRHRLGDALDTVPEMMQRQVDWATSHGLTDRVDLLAEHGFVASGAPDSPAVPAIHRAGTPAGVRAAVAAGADPDAIHDGHTALHQQAWIGDVEMVGALLAAGADPTLLDETYRATPLDWAEHGRQPATAALLRSAARIDSTEM